MLNKKSRLYNLLILPSISIIILTGFLLTFSVNVSASVDSSYFPMQQNYNNLFPSEYSSSLDIYFDSENNYIFACNPTLYSWGVTCNVFVFPKSSSGMVYGEISSNGYQFSLYTIGSVIGNSYYCVVGTGGYVEPYGSDFTVYQGLYSSLYSSSVDYVSNFKLYADNSSSGNLVLLYGDDDGPSYDVSTEGHAVPPGSYDNPTVNSGSNHQLPHEVPEAPTINNYNWTTYNNPSIDTSTVETLLESLIDVITYLGNWLASNIAGEFSNLISNLVGFFDYIAETLQYYGGLIISNIQNGITTLYENFVALLEPITVPFLTLVAMGTDPETGFFSVPYLTGVLLSPDPVALSTVLIEHDAWDIMSVSYQVMTKVPNLFNQLLALTPTPKFHIPSLIYHGQQIGDFDVDFSWYAAYKVYVDIILNAFLIFGYSYWFFLTFGSHLRGHFMEAEPNNPDSNARLFRG